MNKAIFLDRDGTINKEVNYLYKVEDFVFIDGVIEAIKYFNDQGYKVIVVSNQAGVAKGYYTEDDIVILHNHIDKLLKEHDAKIDKYYYCPHHIEGKITKYRVNCNCRKPNIEMFNQAVKEFDISLKDSIMVGDKELDVLAGKNAGVGINILVRSGHKIDEDNTVADCIFDNLYQYILEVKNR